MMTFHWLLKPCPQVVLHSFSRAKLTAPQQKVSLSPVATAQLACCHFNKLNWHPTQLNHRECTGSNKVMQLGMEDVIRITVTVICSVNSAQSTAAQPL